MDPNKERRNDELLRSITTAEVDTYEKDGVVWLRGILDLKWVSLLDATIEEILAQCLGQYIDFTGLGLGVVGPKLKATGKWSKSERNWGTADQLSGTTLLDESVKPEAGRRGHYISATDTWKSHEAMRQLTIASPVPKIAAILMRSNKVRLYQDQVLVKPPGTMEKTAWHSDQGYDHIAGEQVCAVRIPSRRESSEMGLVQYLRGSHKSGKVHKVNYFISDATDDSEGEPIPQIEGHESNFDIVTFAPEPGDVVVHHLRTLHGAGGNASQTETRSAVTIRYAGDDARYKFRRFAPPSDAASPQLHDGDSLDGDAERFPLAEV